MIDHTNNYYDSTSSQLITDRLKELHEYDQRERLSTDELKEKLKLLERQRHLMIWHDNSTVANHGYLVCLVSVLYDPAIFLTNAEYKIKTGKTVDVQTMVEKPQVHFIARCSSSEAEQIAYSETRMVCINETATNLRTANGNEIVDTLRFFHGDSPARQFESGQQKGGNYYCSNCGCHATRVHELDHAMNCPLISLQDRVDVIMKPGTVSRENTLLQKPKPLSGLSKGQLEKELGARGIFSGKTKQELQSLLDMELQGIQRVPALSVNDPRKSVKDLHLGSYEILPTEPLHDIGHHIENVFTELPHHLKAQEKKAFEECASLRLGNKESKRGVDYRAALAKATAYLKQNGLLAEKELQVLETLTEMQRILYSPDEKRSPQLIVRYYNQSWYHAMLLKQLISQPRKLTLRKMFGVYFHDITTHGGLMLHLISGQAANAEEEERIFHHIKAITKKTSNYSNSQIIPNLFLRLQAEKKMGMREDASRQQGYISNLSKSLPAPQNTRVPVAVIKKHPREWQAHLQHISDYLCEGEGVWWHHDNEAVEFHDVSGFPSAEESGPLLHHFRSSSMKKEEAHLQQCWQQCWQQCINQNNVVPAHMILIDRPNGSVQKVHTDFLDTLPEDETPDQIVMEPDVPADDSNILQEHEEDTNQPLLQSEESNDEEVLLDISPAVDELVQLAEVTDLPPDQGPQLPTISQSSVHSPSDRNASHTTRPDHSVYKEAHTNLEETSSTEYTMQTRLGKALEVVLGKTNELKRFEKKYIELKNTKERNKHSEENYKDALASLQTQVLAENARFHKDLLKWEEDYLLTHNLASPSYEAMKADATAAVLLKVKYSKALLKEWKIGFS